MLDRFPSAVFSGSFRRLAMFSSSCCVTPLPLLRSYVFLLMCLRACSGSASMSMASIPSSLAAWTRRLSAVRRMSHLASLAADIWRASAS